MKFLSLISSFFTMIFIFLASDVVLQFGAYGGIILCASFFSASLLIYLFKKILFKDKPGLHQTALLYFALCIYLLEAFIVHVWVISTVLRYIDDKHLFVILFCIVLFFLVVFFFVKRTSDLFINACILINLLVTFVMAIMLPNFIYLQRGLETVYHNLIHYHPKVLHSSREGIGLLFFAFTILFFVRIYIVLFLHAINIEKLKSYLLLLSICVGSVMLAFSTMIIVAVTERVQAIHPSTLIISMLDKLMNPYMFTFIWIAMISGSLIAWQITWTLIKRKIESWKVEEHLFRFPLWGVVCMGIMSSPFLYFNNLYILDLLLFFAIWLIPPVILFHFTTFQTNIFGRVLILGLSIYLTNGLLFLYVDYSLALRVILATLLTIILTVILQLFKRRDNHIMS